MTDMETTQKLTLFILHVGSLSDISVPCRGNGITLGITDGTKYIGMQAGSGTSVYFSGRTGLYGEPVGGTYGAGTAITKSLGITTDPTMSGIVCDLSAIPTFKPYFYIRY